MYKAPEYKKLYNTKAWKILRIEHLVAFPDCALCAAQGKFTLAEVVDHKKAHKGDKTLFFDKTNLQSLCKLCHDSIKQRAEKSGRSLGTGLDGLPLIAEPGWPVTEAVGILLPSHLVEEVKDDKA